MPVLARLLDKLTRVRPFRATSRILSVSRVTRIRDRVRRMLLTRPGIMADCAGIRKRLRHSQVRSTTIAAPRDGNAISSTMCTALTGIAGQFGSIYMNANALIYVEYGAQAGDVASTTQVFNTVSYSNYYTALTSQPRDSADKTAIASLRRRHDESGCFRRRRPE